MTPTVLLHPIGLDRASWQFVELPDAVAIDLPGHGAEPAAGAVQLESVADFVAAAVDGPFHLVGLSMGAMVAQHVALRHPEQVVSLVIACASATAAAPTLLERAAALERLGLAGVLDDYLSRWFSASALDGAHAGVEYVRQRLLADDPAVVAAYWRAMAEHDVLASLPAITAPTTVIAGSHDASAPVAKLQDIAARIPGAHLRVIDGPHMLQLESPQPFQAALIEHLDRTRRAA